jgi:hypothetical protein
MRHDSLRYLGSFVPNLIHTLHWTLPGFESHGVKELLLSGDHFVKVFGRVKVECGLNPRMTQVAAPAKKL